MTVDMAARPGVGGGRPHFANQDGLGAAGAGRISRIRGVAEVGGLDWRNWLKGSIGYGRVWIQFPCGRLGLAKLVKRGRGVPFAWQAAGV